MLLLDFARLMPQKSSAVPGRFAPGPCLCAAIAASVLLIPVAAPAQQTTPVLLDARTTELQRALASLGKKAPGKPDSEKQLPPYFLSYEVSDASGVSVRAQFGALVDSSANHARVADVQVRLGSSGLDNTHGDHRGSAVNSLQLPLTDDREALGRSLWLGGGPGDRTTKEKKTGGKKKARERGG